MSSPPTKSKVANNTDNLIWVDLEMSGLDVEKERILEVSCIITDPQLDIVAEGPNLVVHQPDAILDSMDEWCTQHHGESGLTKAVRESNVSVEEAERQVLEFVSQHTVAGMSPLAGNSVHADKAFITKYMPDFAKHLHYRIVDVSTVKELCRRWYPEEFNKTPKKQLCHRALEDIKESIAELRYYRKAIFREPSDTNS
ncbi:hypothetical protein ScPMuIL_017825 [Solemya velum]